METNPLTIELKTGYTDREGKTHKSVTFGRPVTGSVLFEIEESPQSIVYLQRELLAIARSITAFGTLPMYVPLTTLLELDEFDIADLMDGYDKFNEQLTEGRTPEFISDDGVKLSIGFEKDGLLYPHVTFGNVVKGRDVVQAEIRGFKGIKGVCYLIGRQIKSLKTEDGAKEIQGPIDIELFDNLLDADIVALRAASERRRATFRRQRAIIQEEVD
jgi:hypothetical protein